MKTGLALVLLVGIAGRADSQERHSLRQFIDAMSMPAAYAEVCAAAHGELDPRVIATMKIRARQSGYDPESRDFVKLLELETAKSAALFRNDSSRCLETKIELESLLRPRS